VNTGGGEADRKDAAASGLQATDVHRDSHRNALHARGDRELFVSLISWKKFEQFRREHATGVFNNSTEFFSYSTEFFSYSTEF
jgi:hypothetical protein